VTLLLALPLGVGIGLALGALGGGGSILAVPALVYVVGLRPTEAVTTSLLVVGVAALVAMVPHWRAGRVRVGTGLCFGAAGVLGALVGTRLNRLVDPDVLLASFALVMVVAAWRMWAGARTRRPAMAVAAGPDGPPAPVPAGASGASGASGTGGSRSGATVATVAAVAGAGTVVGLMTGFFGVGGGFVIVPALVLVLRFEMPVAVGTSLLVIAMNSATALAARLGSSSVDWHVAVPFTVAALAGALTGSRVAGRTNPATLSRWFAGLLVAVAAYTLIRSALAL